ncbi:phenylacetate--CoA ligase family protein [Marinobacter sp. NP-4(2019)]|uniref:phenylacetate--CoA ligase family protein n=1 Tax=Marinobacter sp. NP-4(2019) TaxID=2488665 RepID=UPI000FC3E752|nr:phenylacetate--CoA ligase family protein [Marinobacter sp. NP-4(2019)]AZT84115.1 phenylacetate--CoA ligase family protein [Marinobacter sp. NP-4(2019)]
MESTLARKLFEAGARSRNPSLFQQYEYLKSTEWLSRQELDKIQLENTVKLLEFAQCNSPYYKKVFEDAGFNTRQFSKLSDLNFLPELDKATLIVENSRIHTSGIAEKVRLAETSGTSGEALAFYRNERWDSLNRAAMMRSYDWYGVKPWDRNGYLWGYNTNSLQTAKVKILDYIQNRFRLFNYSNSEIRKFCHKLLDASFISGYSSMVYEVAKCVNELDLGPIPLKMVKGTSEMILDVYHEETVRAFGGRIISEYGAAESGLIAFECPYGGIHVNIENVVLEEAENGGLLVTNLCSYSFPIIRYRLGDMVTLSDDSCKCGRKHPLIKDICGRKGANVQGVTSKFPALTFYYVFKNLALEKDIFLNYKAIQQNKGEVEILIEGNDNNRYLKEINEQLQKYFGEDVNFSIIFVDRFAIDMKKRQYFETSL